MSRAQVQATPFIYPLSQWGPFAVPTAFNVLDKDDTNYLCPLSVLDKDDTAHVVTKTVLDKDDTGYVVS